jgi:hypothetical protein
MVDRATTGILPGDKAPHAAWDDLDNARIRLSNLAGAQTFVGDRLSLRGVLHQISPDDTSARMIASLSDAYLARRDLPQPRVRI